MGTYFSTICPTNLDILSSIIPPFRKLTPHDSYLKKAPVIIAKHIEYNYGLMKIFQEAKSCYYNNKDIETFTTELEGTILKLLIQKK